MHCPLAMAMGLWPGYSAGEEPQQVLSTPVLSVCPRQSTSLSRHHGSYCKIPQAVGKQVRESHSIREAPQQRLQRVEQQKFRGNCKGNRKELILIRSCTGPPLPISAC